MGKLYWRDVALATASFLAITYVFCVAFDLFFGQRMYEAWMKLLPGFVWLTWPGFLLGLLESFLYGIYFGLVFVPLSTVDPIYFEKTYYLGPDKGGEKAYRLLTDAMVKAKRVALAQFCMRGKESLVLIRPSQNGLMLHTMYFADEVRSFAEIDKGAGGKIRDGEMELAQQLIDGLTNDDFKPESYQDSYRLRVLDLINSKVEGKEITLATPEPARAQVIDLMDALKQSLGKRGSSGTASSDEAGAAALQKKPAAKARQKAEPAPKLKKVAGKR